MRSGPAPTSTPLTAASLSLDPGDGRYGRRRESDPTLLPHRVRSAGGQHLDLRVRRPTAVLGPLATYAEPHAYDLCEAHSERLSAPRGWDVLRLAPDPRAAGPTTDDLLALADAVREAARPVPVTVSAPAAETGREVARKGHLRMLTTD